MRKASVFISLLIILAGCSTIDTQAEYTSAKPRSSNDLVMPPGLSAPDLGTNYTLANLDSSPNGYQLNKIQNMKIVEAGSERWLVVESKSVDQVYPMVLAYLNQAGLTVKYKNQSVGLIQTDWATKNNTVKQGAGIRGFFSWLGWGSMYTLPSQYMFRITIWQNGNNAQVFVTNYAMDEVYSNGSPPHNSSIEPSNYPETKWIARAPNPQIELEFLMNFMAFSGFSEPQVQQIAKQFSESASQSSKMAYLNGRQLVINDTFDRAWWRTGLALERVGLGVADKDRSNGIYYVYPLQGEIDNPKPGLFSKWFGSSESSTVELPTTKYLVTLSQQQDNTVVLTMSLAGGVSDKNFAMRQQQYLQQLLTQLQ